MPGHHPPSERRHLAMDDQKIKCSLSMSNKDLRFEWDILAGKDWRKWDKKDLQLAAELGKTLLERNKALEAALKQCQHEIEDKMQEIEQLNKHNVAQREANESRMKIYEQLDLGIWDLEQTKYKLTLENKAEKKKNRQLHSTIEGLEAKVEELTRTLMEERRQMQIEKRDIAEKQAATAGTSTDIVEVPTLPSPASVASDHATQSTTTRAVEELHHNDEADEELIRVMLLLDSTQKNFVQERDKVAELEEQLMALTQENQMLQKKLSQNTNNDEVKTVHQEISLLDELKQGQLCTNCLRDLADRRDENSIISGNDDDDDRSLNNLIEASEMPKTYRSELYIQLPLETCGEKPQADDGSVTNNLYRELIEYEALLEGHRQKIQLPKSRTSSGSATPVESCLDHSKVVGFGNDLHYSNGFNPPMTSERTNNSQRQGTEAAISTGATRPMVTVPSDNHYRPETASSGYLDDVCHKATQTDEGSRDILCTIANDKDRLGFYVDQSAIDSRFRSIPAHREVFREIVSVLKKEAETREEGEQLPLKDDTTSDFIFTGSAPMAELATIRYTPTTPINEETLYEFGEDDTASFVTTSSAISEQSIAMSECITRAERKKRVRHQASAITTARHGTAGQQKDGGIGSKPPTSANGGGTGTVQQSSVPLEYLSGSKRKSHRRNRNRTTLGNKGSESAELEQQTPVRSKGSRRIRYRPWNPDFMDSFGSSNGPSPRDTDGKRPASLRWDNKTTTIHNRSQPVSKTPSVDVGYPKTTMKSKSRACATINRNAELADDASDIVELVPSTASQHLHMLQEIDLTYAEVLRGANTRQARRPRKPRQQYTQPMELIESPEVRIMKDQLSFP
ncbi:uncharacterized protein LOC126579844 isoform X2 [Anopheles aquasalis]|uniref:uncharacterized protein LOC126579844 isoform X2 n=1 Tax=Anopheles aquasalis TaxID=42839 RepID=UPI00215AC5C1|nr:uncharacterized protein LOC126579844 isoform X2 [Anopheles aquasalis]